jgi:outer membrane protein OmpA-like peptidoglycan-associated protein
MSSSLLDSLSQLVTPDLLGQAASMLGESQGNVSRGVSAALPMLLGSVASRATDTNFASSLFKLVTDSRNDLGAVGNIAQLLTPGSSNSSISALGGQLLGSLFGSNTNAVTSALAGYAGIKPQSANSLLSMAAPMVLGVLGKSVRSGGLNMSSLASLLKSQKGAISAALPTGLNLDRYLAAPTAAVAAVAAPAAKSSIWRWLLPLLLVLGALLLLSRCMKKDEVVQSLPAPAPQAEVAPAPLPAPVEVALPRADVFFDVAKTELPADAGTALAGVIAYLVANPTSMAVVSGYHDPTGDLATNEELAKNRALAVRGALVAGGVTAARIDLQKPVVSTGDGSLEAARRVEVTIR